MPPLHTDSVRLCYCPGSCWSPLLRPPSEFMDTVDSGFCPIWGLLEEDGTPSPRAGKLSIQAFVPVLVPLATSFLPSQPRSELVRLRGQEITLTGVTTQFLRSLAWPALGWRLATACRLQKQECRLQIHSLTLSKKSWSVLGSTPNSPCLPSQANLCFPLKNILMVSCFLQLSDIQKFHLFFKVPKSVLKI